MTNGLDGNEANDQLEPSGHNDDYKVGNKNPPLHTRFQPGASGNPKGRPKGSVGLKQKLQKELGKTVTVSKNGRPIRMTKADFVAQQVVAAAMKGDHKFTSLLIGVGEGGSATETPNAAAVADLPFPDTGTIRHIIARAQRLIEEA
jgi:hypothetical protein